MGEVQSAMGVQRLRQCVFASMEVRFAECADIVEFQACVTELARVLMILHNPGGIEEAAGAFYGTGQ